MWKLVVWGVHLLTASGAALALIAAIAVAHDAWQTVFLCLGIALIIDGVDGTLARIWRVKERLPWFDGAALDFVVDYTNYVFIPAMVLADGGLLTGPWAMGAGIVVAVVGALYFADTRMKTADKAFRGFPAMWNVVVYLLMIYQPSETVVLLVIAACSVLTFVPVEFVHPVRVEKLRPLNLLVALVWGILAIIALIDDLKPGLAVAIGLGLASLYLAVVGAILQLMRARPGP
jgi:phosphatidylcholine synthase